MTESEKRLWTEFRDAGLLWWTNRGLHLFGWAIVFTFSEDGKDLVKVAPERVEWRGFKEATEEQGFRRLTRYMHENGKYLREEVER